MLSGETLVGVTVRSPNLVVGFVLLKYLAHHILIQLNIIMNTKKCKFCQSEIDKNARKCPQCQADLRSWFSRHPILTIIGLMILVSSTLAANSDTSSVSNTITNESGENVPAVEIISIETKATESNPVWTKYSWVLTVKNNSDRSKTISPTFKWVDDDKFVLDQANEYGLSLPAGEESTFNGYQLIDAGPAQNVSGIEVEL